MAAAPENATTGGRSMTGGSDPSDPGPPEPELPPDVRSAHGDPNDGLWSPARRRLTIGLVLTITLVAFESLAVSTIMPIVSRDLQGIDLYGWVFSAFFLGSLVGIVVVGGLIDRGRLVRPFVAGLGLFAIGLLIDGTAPAMPVLVAGRLLQGLGGGAIAPTAYVAIGRSLPEPLRPRMFATMSTAWVLPGVVGPALAGAVGEHLGWRLVFIALLPIIGVAMALTIPALRAVPAAASAPAAVQGGVSAPRRVPFALVLAAGAGLLLAGLTSDSIVAVVVLVPVGLLLGVPAFARLTPAGTVRAARGLPAAVLLRGLLTFTFFGADAYVPFALQDWRGVSPAISGLALTSATVAWTAGAWLQARWMDRWGAPALIRVGLVVVFAGVASTALVLEPDVPVAIAVVTWGVAGFGMGMAYSPLVLLVLRDAVPGAEGAATSGLQLSDVLGTALGTGAAGAIVAAGARIGAETWVGVAGAFGLAAAVGLVGTLVARRLRAESGSGGPSRQARLRSGEGRVKTSASAAMD